MFLHTSTFLEFFWWSKHIKCYQTVFNYLKQWYFQYKPFENYIFRLKIKSFWNYGFRDETPITNFGFASFVWIYETYCNLFDFLLFPTSFFPINCNFHRFSPNKICENHQIPGGPLPVLLSFVIRPLCYQSFSSSSSFPIFHHHRLFRDHKYVSSSCIFSVAFWLMLNNFSQ